MHLANTLLHIKKNWNHYQLCDMWVINIIKNIHSYCTWTGGHSHCVIVDNYPSSSFSTGQLKWHLPPRRRCEIPIFLHWMLVTLAIVLHFCSLFNCPNIHRPITAVAILKIKHMRDSVTELFPVVNSSVTGDKNSADVLKQVWTWDDEIYLMFCMSHLKGRWLCKQDKT